MRAGAEPDYRVMFNSATAVKNPQRTSAIWQSYQHTVTAQEVLGGLCVTAGAVTGVWTNSVANFWGERWMEGGGVRGFDYHLW